MHGATGPHGETGPHGMKVSHGETMSHGEAVSHGETVSHGKTVSHGETEVSDSQPERRTRIVSHSHRPFVRPSRPSVVCFLRGVASCQTCGRWGGTQGRRPGGRNPRGRRRGWARQGNLREDLDFSFSQRTVFPSVRLSVRPSVCPSVRRGASLGVDSVAAGKTWGAAGKTRRGGELRREA